MLRTKGSGIVTIEKFKEVIKDELRSLLNQKSYEEITSDEIMSLVDYLVPDYYYDIDEFREFIYSDLELYGVEVDEDGVIIEGDEQYQRALMNLGLECLYELMEELNEPEP
jgi:cell division ATPase FtsA